MNVFHDNRPFHLESGEALPEIFIAYDTYGTLNSSGDNVVWICHHLTANSDAAAWWPGMVGEGKIFDPSQHFIVCANILGSCYGSSGPLTINPSTGKPFHSSFPFITIRDMVKAHRLLSIHLGINKIAILAGGSMGGYQALEWAVDQPDFIHQMILLSTSASETAWGIAIHTAQRLAIEADCSWQTDKPDAGSKGLKAARAIGLISYRNYDILVAKQTDPDPNKSDGFRSSSYMIYQGEKLVNRFNAFSYWLLTKAMDSHNLARNRNKPVTEILRSIHQRTLVVGIKSDILCPLAEQQLLTSKMPAAKLVTIDSIYGHDGFMVESDLISRHISQWLQG
jgi:homoserine O-acetyltransferase/O-succinyltransferase